MVILDLFLQGRNTTLGSCYRRGLPHPPFTLACPQLCHHHYPGGGREVALLWPVEGEYLPTLQEAAIVGSAHLGGDILSPSSTGLPLHLTCSCPLSSDLPSLLIFSTKMIARRLPNRVEIHQSGMYHPMVRQRKEQVRGSKVTKW